MAASRYILASVIVGCVAVGSVLTVTCTSQLAPELPQVRPESGQFSVSGDQDRATETIRLRILAKNRIVDGLADDGLPLLDAAALFRELDRIPPTTPYPLVTHPGHPLPLTSPTADESCCGAVILFAHNSLKATRPDQAEVVTKRLVVEFWTEKRRQGAVRLPDPANLEQVIRSLGFGPNDWPPSMR